MKLSKRLQWILEAELNSGNFIAGTHENQFTKAKYLVILRKPWHSHYELPEGVSCFTNRDSHYPMGKAYKDELEEHILLAPEGLH